MRFYCEEAEAVLRDVDSTSEGLTSAEAEKRLAAYGKNKLAEGKKDSLIKRFFQQMGDPMIIILLVAAAISGVTGRCAGRELCRRHHHPRRRHHQRGARRLSGKQGGKGHRSPAADVRRHHPRCCATGRWSPVHSEDLVVGDVVILEAGDAVPADGRILDERQHEDRGSRPHRRERPRDASSSTSSTLRPTRRMSRSATARTWCYMGSTVVYGRGTAVITATGMDTEMGKIADALAQCASRARPRCRSSSASSRKILTLARARHLRHHFRRAAPARGRLQTVKVILDYLHDRGLALAVAAIPEGLAAVVTVVLSIGVTNMSKPQRDHPHV